MAHPSPPNWPAGLPRQLSAPATSVFVNLEISACRYPERPATVFYGAVLTYRQLLAEVEALAGYLQHVCGVARGDRVLLDLQNSPQFVIAYYAILRADAMVVPLNPMLQTAELRHYVQDSGARVAIAAQDVFAQLAPLLGAGGLEHAVVATYADYLAPAAVLPSPDLPLPDFVAAPRAVPDAPGVIAWSAALAAARAHGQAPRPHAAGPDDLACMPYTSGTTGQPKGCIHTHRSLMFTAVAGAHWAGPAVPDQALLAALPLFHVTGMQGSMNAVIYCGATIVLLPRWNRDAAGALIARHHVTGWSAIPTMLIDFLANPRLADYDLSSLRRIGGGGAPMPAAVAQRLLELTGLRYIEGYGLSETMAPSHTNPPQAPRQQCLGLPICSTEALVVDPDTLQPLAPGAVGEIAIHGPQLFQGYWNDPAKTAAAFFEHGGKRFFRSGDLGYMDADGYFYFTDRVKRMINASGFKVWPAEVEAALHRHPAIQECCVIAARDAYRGETVKALVVAKAGSALAAADIIAWARTQMAAYKAPALVEFVDSLPKSATGKVLWRVLQERELAPEPDAANGAGAMP